MTAGSTGRKLEADGHTIGCPENGEACTSPVATHSDIFCEGCHDWFEQPHVLSNGTDVAWPANWTRDQAAQWRREHNLVSQAQAGPHDRPELTNATSTAGAGTLPASGSADPNDMAPTG